MSRLIGLVGLRYSMPWIGDADSTASKPQRHVREPAHVRRVHPRQPALIHLEPADGGQNLLHRYPRLHPRQGRAQAGVQAAAETQMVAWIALQVEAFAVGEFALVTVGAGEQQGDLGALGDGAPM